MTKDEARTKIYYICARCKKNKWTLRQNYTEPMYCPSCKCIIRKEKEDPDFFKKKSEKAKATIMKKYGGYNFAEKANETKKRKYGAIVSQEMRKKISQTLRNKSDKEKQKSYEKKVKTQRIHYNGEYFKESSKKNIGLWTKTIDGRTKISKIKKAEAFTYRNSKEHIEYETKVIKSIGYSIIDILKDDKDETYFKLKCFKCGNIFDWFMISDKCRPSCEKCFSSYAGYSQAEKEIVSYLRDLMPNETIVENDRKILHGKELDIYLPNKRIAIEYDGLYFHNNVNNCWKYDECEKAGIRLIQITEPEWLMKKDIIKSFLAATFNIFKYKIGARNCIVKKIDNNIYKQFCEENHIQGYASATMKYGLFYNNELVEVESFSKPRFSKKYDYELVRECSKNGYLVYGGKSKLFKQFCENHSPKSIISYCEKNKFSGISYFKNGFVLDHVTKSNYEYFLKNFVPLNRMQFQKHKLKNKLKNFDPNLTEWENMNLNGYKRLFDYGQFVFIKNF